MDSKEHSLDRRSFLETGLQAAAGAAAVGGSLPHPLLAQQNKHQFEPPLPTSDEMFGWVTDLWRFGHDDRYGYRMPGTQSDHQGTKYILQKFQEFGLKDAHLEPVPVAVAFPDQWTLTVRTQGQSWKVPCYFLRYARFTGPEGITADMVYVAEGTEADYAHADVKGKIVVADIVSDGLPANWSGFDWPHSFFTYDQHNSLPDDRPTENWPIKNQDAYRRAVEHGAAGFVAILELMAGDVNQYLHWYLLNELPALSVSPRDGARLRSLLKSGRAEAHMVLTGEQGQGVTHNVYGFLPGRNQDEQIVMMSHTDGWATNEASGISVVMGLAKYLAQFPPESRERTLMFFGVGSHFGLEADWSGQGLEGVGSRIPDDQVAEYFKMKADWSQHECLAYQLLPKTVCANNVEMIGRHYKRQGDDFVLTGRIAPRSWGVTGPSSGPKPEANPALLAFVQGAIQKHDMDRSVVIPRHPGEADRYKKQGIPTVNLISHNPWQFTSKDTPDTVMKEALQPTVAALADILRKEDVAPRGSLQPVDPE